MKRLLIGIVLLIATYGFGYSATIVPQREVVPDSWKRVSACHVSFLVPASVENLNDRGIDSCVAGFGNSDMRISIDYGGYGFDFRKRASWFDEELKRFKLGFIRVGGRRAQVVTYYDGREDRTVNPHLRHVAGMYVVVRTYKSEGIRTKTSLNMYVEGRSEREQEIANQIFRSVRFQ